MTDPTRRTSLDKCNKGVFTPALPTRHAPIQDWPNNPDQSFSVGDRNDIPYARHRTTAVRRCGQAVKGKDRETGAVETAWCAADYPL